MMKSEVGRVLMHLIVESRPVGIVMGAGMKKIDLG